MITMFPLGVMSKDPLKIEDHVNYKNVVVGCAYCGAVMPHAPFPTNSDSFIHRPTCGKCGSFGTYPKHEMNTESVDCTRQPYPTPPDTVSKAGDFCWGPVDDEGIRHLYIHIPGETFLDSLKVRLGEPGGNRVWGWDGNEDKPTLTPSIHSVGTWHGHLRNGRLESC